MIIAGADLNETNGKTDRLSNNQNRVFRNTYGFKHLAKHNSLIDIWRICNTHKKQFTWRRKYVGEHSRLYFFLIENCINNIKSCDIRPAQIQHTYHMAVSLKIQYNSSKGKGRGIWKLNNSYIENDEYIDLINKVIDDVLKGNDNLNPSNLWDYCKVMIKYKTVEFCKEKSKKKKDDINCMEKALVAENMNFDENPCSETQDKIIKKINEFQNQLNVLYQERAKGVQIRARVDWLENGEK